MKYIIFEQVNTGLKMPVIFPDHITHSSVIIEGAQPVSAGFCQIEVKNIIGILPQISESLNIGPHPGDRELLISLLRNEGMYAFIRF